VVSTGRWDDNDERMTPFKASVIVRARDKEATIGQALMGLERQTVRPEIIVVDSGSRDGTLDIARRHCDKLIEIPPEEFTYGRALNLGAAAASAPIHFALSAHCTPSSNDWIERYLAHYARPDVAGVCGTGSPARESEAEGPWVQDADQFWRDPMHGFSNHASSWRAEVWRDFPFNENVPSAEDKEWAGRVLDAGWVLAFDPSLEVATDYLFERGLREYFRRRRRDYAAIGSFAPLPPYGLRALLDDCARGAGRAARGWWNVAPDGRRSRTRLRLGPFRAADLAARYAASRTGSKRNRG
jgi:glycosyltransferase involved in cell wall biosynthesis